MTGLLTSEDMEVYIDALMEILSFRFHVMDYSFSLLDVFAVILGTLTIYLVFDRVIFFYFGKRR